MPLPAPLRRALEPHADFAALPVPGPNDWLANHPEPGQSFADFVRWEPHRPGAMRRKLYLQPLDAFTPGRSLPLEPLQTLAAAFFTLEVNVLPALDIAVSGITTRQNSHTHRRQLRHEQAIADLQQTCSGATRRSRPLDPPLAAIDDARHARFGCLSDGAGRGRRI